MCAVNAHSHTDHSQRSSQSGLAVWRHIAWLSQTMHVWGLLPREDFREFHLAGLPSQPTRPQQ